MWSAFLFSKSESTIVSLYRDWQIANTTGGDGKAPSEQDYENETNKDAWLMLYKAQHWLQLQPEICWMGMFIYSLYMLLLTIFWLICEYGPV